MSLWRSFLLTVTVEATALAVVFACSDPQAPAPPPPPAIPTAVRLQLAMDSLNAAIRQLYEEGGEVTYFGLLYPDPVGTAAPPPVAAILVRP